MNKQRTILSLALMACCAAGVYAQDAVRKVDSVPAFWLGGYGALGLNAHSASFGALPGYPLCCPQFDGGSGIGFTVGALFELPVSEQLRLQFRAGYTSWNGKLTQDQVIGNAGIVNPSGAQVPTAVNVQYSIDAAVSTVELEALAAYYITPQLSVSAGLAGGPRLGATFTQKEELLSPSTLTFLDGRRVRNEVANTDIPQKSSFALYIPLGVSYGLPIGKHSTLNPEVRYFLPLGDITAAAPWSISSLQLGASVKFGIVPSKDIPIVRDTVILRDTTVMEIVDLPATAVELTSSDEKTEKVATEDLISYTTTIREKWTRKVNRVIPFSLGLDVFGVGMANGRQKDPQIVIEETEVGESFPLIPYVFFADGGASLQETGLRRVTEGATADFDEKKIDASALKVYSNNLNVIGARLRRDRSLKIRIVGCSSGVGEDAKQTDIARRRAESVKSYLSSVWGIDGARMSTEARGLPEKPSNNDVPDGQAENRRVEIIPSSPKLLVPVTISEVTRSSNPPGVQIVPSFAPMERLKDWKVTVSESGVVLRSFSGDADDLGPMTWNVMEPPFPSKDNQTVVNFTASDVTGASKSTEQRISIRQLTINRKRSEVKNDVKIEIFSLVLFDFGKSDVGPENAAIIQEVREKIQPNSTVTIYGYADRTGTADYNRKLAERRCQEVASRLRGLIPADKLSIKPVGSDELLYDNDLPEGRNYSRTVRIVIETPVNQ